MPCYANPPLPLSKVLLRSGTLGSSRTPFVLSRSSAANLLCSSRAAGNREEVPISFFPSNRRMKNLSKATWVALKWPCWKSMIWTTRSVAMSTLKKGLKANSFYFFLSKKFSYDFFGLLTWAISTSLLGRGWWRNRRRSWIRKGLGRTTWIPSQRSGSATRSFLIDLRALNISRTSHL